MRASHARRAVTLIECMIAITVLSIATVGITMPVLASYRNFAYAERADQGAWLAEHLMEEIVSRPLHGGDGMSRATWSIEHYHAFTEAFGALRDCSSALYSPATQQFSRRVSVVSHNVLVPELAGASIPGLLITITVERTDGQTWILSRFVPQSS